MTCTPSAACTRLNPAEIDGLAQLLIDCVEGGASVSFMHPLALAEGAAPSGSAWPTT